VEFEKTTYGGSLGCWTLREDVLDISPRSNSVGLPGSRGAHGISTEVVERTRARAALVSALLLSDAVFSFEIEDALLRLELFPWSVANVVLALTATYSNEWA